MKIKNEKIEAIVKKAINCLVDAERYEWPPQCGTFFYQPTRPQEPASNQTKTKFKTRD